MSVIFHLVRSDLVRMRLWLLCWLGVLVAPLLLGAHFVTHDPLANPDWGLRRLPAALAICVGLQGVVGYLLTILLLLEHPIVGSRQFWLTRPISRGRMLAAKAIGVFLTVGLIPVIVNLPWWLWCGIGAANMAEAAFEIITVMMLIAVPAAVIAVLTDSFPRALLWSVLLVAVVSFVAFFYLIVNSSISVRNAGEMSFAIARSLVAIFGVAIEMLALIVVQFHVRRRGWWLMPFAAAMFVTVVASTQWPWPWAPLVAPELHAERAAGVTMSYEGGRLMPTNPAILISGRKPLFKYVYTKLHARGIPPGRIVSLFWVEQRWRWPSGVALARDDYFFIGTDPIVALGLRRFPTDPETRQWLEAHPPPGNPFWRESPRGEFTQEISARIPPSLVAKMQAEPPAFAARAWWELWRPEILFEVPVAPGGWIRREDGRLRVIDVKSESARTALTVVDTQPLTVRSVLRSMATIPHLNPFQPQGPRSLIAIDHAHGEALDVLEDGATKTQSVTINGVVIQWRRLAIRAPILRRDGQPVVRPGWENAVRLAEIGGQSEAIFTRDVKTDRFDLAR